MLKSKFNAITGLLIIYSEHSGEIIFETFLTDSTIFQAAVEFERAVRAAEKESRLNTLQEIVDLMQEKTVNL